LAEIFVGPNERMIMAGDRNIKNLEGDNREAIKDDDPITGMNLIRTRFADERLESAVRAGATQVVILGAGYDSRAYRFGSFLRTYACLRWTTGRRRSTRSAASWRSSGAFPQT
jgi:O-methyltransferase involved in polyketide biosynthesis